MQTVRRYLFAVVVIIATIAVRFVLVPVLDERAQYIVLVLPVVVTAWVVGVGPAILASLWGALAALVFLVPPVVTTDITVGDEVASVLYLVVAVTLVALVQRIQRREREIASRNEQLTRVVAEKDALLRLRDRFSGMLSHEIRGPLTVILGDARLLRAGTPDPDQDLLADIQHEAERLHRLVEDLLVVSRGDGELHVTTEPVLLQRLLPGIAATVARRYPRASIELDVAPDLPPVEADPTLCSQIVTNLLTNASKYAGVAPRIRLGAEAAEGTVTITCEDDGPGFPPDALDHVFDAFYRAPSASRAVEGVGVGMYVVRRLVTALGGDAECHNAGPSGGAVVTIRLPQSVIEGEMAPHRAEGDVPAALAAIE